MISDIASYLAENGIGSIGNTIFKSRLPDIPDNCISIYETGGLAPDRYLPTADPTFQIIVRNKTYSAGKSKMDDIVDLLHQKTNSTLVTGGFYFYYIFLMGEPAHIGVDKKDRDEFSANFVCKVRR